MKLIGNVLWVLLGGFWMALGWLFCAVLLAITIIGLPFARQCLKMARFTLWPFGYTTIQSPDASSLGCLGNVLWFIPGLFLAFGYAVSGVLLCVTIIGIPFGIQSFKFVPLALFPFGKEVISQDELGDRLRRPANVAPSHAPPPPSGRPLPPPG